MRIHSSIKNGIYSALAFFGTLIVLSVAYATYQTLTHANPNSTLSSITWNQLIDNVEDLNWRMNNAVPATSLTGTIDKSHLPFRQGQIVGSGSVILTGATANSDTGYYQVEELEANRNLISTSVHWGIGKSQVGTMVAGSPTWRTPANSSTNCATTCAWFWWPILWPVTYLPICMVPASTPCNGLCAWENRLWDGNCDSYTKTATIYRCLCNN